MALQVTNRQLRAAYLSPEMECYFRKKLPTVSAVEVRRRIEEALKFLHMSTQIRGAIPMTEEIDEIWHLWILETRQYARLCAAIPGGTFIDHCSDAYAECSGASSSDLTNDIEEDVAALATYVINYGPLTADRVKYWRLAAYLTSECGMTVHDVNSWLKSGLVTSATAT